MRPLTRALGAAVVGGASLAGGTVALAAPPDDDGSTALEQFENLAEGPATRSSTPPARRRRSPAT